MTLSAIATLLEHPSSAKQMHKHKYILRAELYPQTTVCLETQYKTWRNVSNYRSWKLEQRPLYKRKVGSLAKEHRPSFSCSERFLLWVLQIRILHLCRQTWARRRETGWWAVLAALPLPIHGHLRVDSEATWWPPSYQ